MSEEVQRTRDSEIEEDDDFEGMSITYKEKIQRRKRMIEETNKWGGSSTDTQHDTHMRSIQGFRIIQKESCLSINGESSVV